MACSKTPAPVGDIAHSIIVLRGHKVLLDAGLAALYGVETKVLVQAVKRNAAGFPQDFMLQLTSPEWAALRSQFVTLKPGRGQHRKYLPYAFTEQGVASASQPISMRSADLRAYLDTQDDFAFERRVFTHAKGFVLTVQHAGIYEDPATSKWRQYELRALVHRGIFRSC